MHETSINEVRELAKNPEYHRIPVTRELLADVRTPVSTLKALMNVSSHCFLLESAEDNRQMGRYTFLGFDPKMELSCKDHILTIHSGGTVTQHVDHPGETIQHIIDENKAPKIPGLPTLTGGLVGYFSYEYLQYGEPKALRPTPDEAGFDDVNLMLFDKLICYDNLMQKIILIVNISTKDLEEEYQKALLVLDEMEKLIRFGKEKEVPAGHLVTELQPKLSKEEFAQKVDTIKHHIREGDIFQLVFSNPMEAPYEGSLLNTYRVLRTTNPSPYMFYFTGDDVEIAGASPETLVKSENGLLHTFPLAGTRPRGKTDEEDARLEKELLADEKERAEHNMLVDLGRNDIGKLAEFGSVKVDKYMCIEKYSHVMHIGSSVCGKLRKDKKVIDAVETALPAGTLSGAPKVRACQLISELENDHRGIYGGAIGYIDFSGDLDVCIAIRFACKRKGKVYVRSGAGIVADSVPEKEYQECINKAKAVTEALKQAEEVS